MFSKQLQLKPKPPKLSKTGWSKSGEQSITSYLSQAEILQLLGKVMDMPDGIMIMGQTPGSKSFAGFIKGDTFRLRKKSDSFNAFARELQGRLVTTDSGTIIAYRFEKNTAQSLLVILLIFLSMPILLVSFGELMRLVFDGGTWNRQAAFTEISCAFAVMILVSIASWKGSEAMAFRSDEELLDCLKRIASGAAPVSD